MIDLRGGFNAGDGTNNADAGTTSPSQLAIGQTPDLRIDLGKDWYLLAATDVPVTGPKPLREGLGAWLTRVF